MTVYHDDLVLSSFHLKGQFRGWFWYNLLSLLKHFLQKFYQNPHVLLVVILMKSILFRRDAYVFPSFRYFQINPFYSHINLNFWIYSEGPIRHDQNSFNSKARAKETFPNSTRKNRRSLQNSTRRLEAPKGELPPIICIQHNGNTKHTSHIKVRRIPLAFFSCEKKDSLFL